MKREAQAHKDLGEELLALPDAEFDALDLDERLVDAVESARRMKSREALRRQKQFIAKLLMNVDTTAIREHVEQRDARIRQHKKHFQAAERWRDRIVREGKPALEAFETAIGHADPDTRDMLAKLDHVRSDNEEKGLKKAIFRSVFDALATRYAKPLADAADDR